MKKLSTEIKEGKNKSPDGGGGADRHVTRLDILYRRFMHRSEQLAELVGLYNSCKYI
jgi:hypothetical protein